MHILYFHQYFSTPDGAAGTRSYEIAKALVASGHRVTMICGSGKHLKIDGLRQVRDGEKRGAVDGIDVIQYELPYSNRDSFIRRAITFIRYALKSIRVVLFLDYDLIYATSTPLTAAIPGVAAKLTMRGKPFVFEVRDLWPELPKAMGVIRNPIVLMAMSALEWLAYRSANMCVGLAPGIVAGIRKRSSSSLPVELIPNSCDLSLFRPDVNPACIKGVADGTFVALFAGAHGIANGLDAVLDVAEELKRRGRGDIKLVFIGDGNRKDALVERAEGSGLDNCVFLDSVPKTSMPGLLVRADLGLMILDDVPAFYNGTSPNKFFDYISSGLPVLINYPGWLSELVVEHECGVSVTPQDACTFADALERLADGDEDLATMAFRARALAGSKFNRSALCDRLISLLEGFSTV